MMKLALAIDWHRQSGEMIDVNESLTNANRNNSNFHELQNIKMQYYFECMLN